MIIQYKRWTVAACVTVLLNRDLVLNGLSYFRMKLTNDTVD